MKTRKYIAIVASAILALYLIVSLLVAIVIVQNTMSWCQYKNGDYGDIDRRPTATGKRWEPNAMTMGLTGKCINPGDKGL